MFGFWRKKNGLEKAKENFKKDFGFSISNAPDEGVMLKTFSNMIALAGGALSNDAQTALLYRLYCMNFLAAATIMREGGEKIDINNLIWIPDFLNRSIDYSERAKDHILLESISGNLNRSIEIYLASFNINRG
ncbi:TPA: hypothetical protein L9060_003844 [Klebsiella pneumoniae]|jgi:hypothetical protein|uniref:hypothetical protein n=1 Tax=Klebsiella pneumoniae complex TaxID=3390273 RepID=UPI0020768CBD|nr:MULTISPECIES: hypothetical protein [Klebsiella]HBY0535262.1 hypothetical protein [Klebsiella pneumoniae subsp. pneumoniae]HDH1449413.1 hypothetical protein [Klebsiella quasipneumoniae subsp. similipneumoniae]MCM8547078.1 hypothetical protein [Klebsiella quasipneumoniae]MDG0002671.1 hypothetical protein [Klebsiella pneumoniae]HBR5699228.1 hypothetical protein [Klebsiella pneumoniae]